MKPEMNEFFMNELMQMPAIQESLQRRAAAEEKALVDGRMLTLDKIDMALIEIAANACALENAIAAFKAVELQKHEALINVREIEHNGAMLWASYNHLEKDLSKKYSEQCVLDAANKLNHLRAYYQHLCDALNSSISRVTQPHVITNPKRKHELKVQFDAAKHMLLAVDSAIPQIDILRKARISPTILEDKIEKILAGIPATGEGAING